MNERLLVQLSHFIIPRSEHARLPARRLTSFRAEIRGDAVSGEIHALEVLG